MSEGIEKGTWPTETLPEGWTWTEFDGFWADYTDSKRKLPQKDYLPAGKFAVVDQGEGVVGGYSNDKSLVSQAPSPAIVFGDHTRAVKYIDFPFLQGADGVRVLSPKEGIDPTFAYAALRCIKLPDKGYSRHFKFLKSSTFPVAPLPEQRRIVAKIDRLSGKSKRAREHLDHVQRLVEKYKQAVLAEAFRGALTRKWRVASSGPSASELANRAKKQALRSRLSNVPTRPLFPAGSFPDEWVLVRLEEICSQIVDGTHHTPTYIEQGIPFISVKDIYDGQVHFEGCKFISEDEHGELAKRCAPKKLDLLITKSGTIGRCAIVQTDIEFSLFVSVALIRPSVKEISSKFLKFALEYWISTINIGSDIVGSAIKNLHLQDMKALGIPLASSDEQNEIVRRIETAFAWIDRLAAEATSARKLIDHLDHAILSKAFRGELVAQDPNDEPASVLLERIRTERSGVTADKKRRVRRVPTASGVT